jgi:C-3',4' desaturase CrtD
MQVLSDRLVTALEKYGGKLQMRHTVEKILTEKGKATGIIVRNQKTEEIKTETADQIVANIPLQNLPQLIDCEAIPPLYRQRIEKLPPASGAFVVYLGVDRAAIPPDCPPHLQFLYDYDGVIGENNSLFVSVSKEGDGRAPAGKATIIASSFTDTSLWWRKGQDNYQQLKEQYTQEAIARLGQYFHLSPPNLVHCESATPRTFERFTGRNQGIVGGIGQRVATFGPFGVATRTPIPHLWLVGDSTHPGEGTAGVSYSALTVVRQIENQ